MTDSKSEREKLRQLMADTPIVGTMSFVSPELPLQPSLVQPGTAN
jgi:hypothetical protein